MVLTPGWYDDGSPDIPDGLAGAVERVVVVGAGIAGLTVANALAHAGIEHVVLEGRDRIGGRLHTVDLAAVPVDLGGSWIHHPVGNPLRRWADEVGVVCASLDPVPSLRAFDSTEGRWLTRDELDAVLDLQFEQLPNVVERLRAQAGPAADATQAVDALVEVSGLEPAAERRARQALRAEIEAQAADATDRQSLQWMWHEMEYDGDFFGDVPVDGYGSVVDALAGGLDVRLGAAVVEVTVRPGGAELACADGSTYSGSHVVLAVPLGVLKGSGVRVAPVLPPGHSDAIERLGFGRYEKVSLAFDAPFWAGAGLTHLVLFPREPAAAAVWVIDHNAYGAGAALTLHVFHSNTGHVIDAAPADAARWALDLLGEAFGAPCPQPSAVAVTSWWTDEFSRGAYSHIPPGANPDEADRLGRPAHGRLLFAGEHTQSARLGYADGAFTSGIREAKRLLGRGAVRLGRL
jgi:polyamine oxidase